MGGCESEADTSNPKHAASATSLEQTSLDVVSKRNAAYNGHDLEAFLATYDEIVRIHNYPDELMGQGVERLRNIFGDQFSEKDGTIDVHSQHAHGNIVISASIESFFGIKQYVIAILYN